MLQRYWNIIFVRSLKKEEEIKRNLTKVPHTEVTYQADIRIYF